MSARERLPLPRVWAQAILAVAGLLTAAEAFVLARKRGHACDVGALQRLVRRLKTENEILRARLLKIEPVHRPRYAPWERLRILWHRTRYGLSLRVPPSVKADPPGRPEADPPLRSASG